MTNTAQIASWLPISGLTVFNVGGQKVFPVYSASGAISAVSMAYLAKSENDFPDYDFGLETGLSENGKFYRLRFEGNRHYRIEEIQAMTEAAEKALS